MFFIEDELVKTSDENTVNIEKTDATNNVDDEDSSDSEDENNTKFPDTRIKIQHFSGTK